MRALDSGDSAMSCSLTVHSGNDCGNMSHRYPLWLGSGGGTNAKYPLRHTADNSKNVPAININDFILKISFYECNEPLFKTKDFLFYLICRV